MYLYLSIILHVHEKNIARKSKFKKIHKDILRNSSLYEKKSKIWIRFCNATIPLTFYPATRPPTFESSVFIGKVPISLLKNSFKYSEIKDFQISEFREKINSIPVLFQKRRKIMLKTTNRKQGNTGTANYSITSF